LHRLPRHGLRDEARGAGVDVFEPALEAGTGEEHRSLFELSFLKPPVARQPVGVHLHHQKVLRDLHGLEREEPAANATVRKGHQFFLMLGEE